MADTQTEVDDELRIAARKVLRAARARPTSRARPKGAFWRAFWRILAILLALAGVTVSFVVIAYWLGLRL